MLESSTSNVGKVRIITTDFRGWTPEELAEGALNRIISVGETSHPAIAAQATAFKDYIRTVLIEYLRRAQEHERTNIIGELEKHGQTDTANLIRRSL